jgi:myo-inositol-1(or 4)-monophosphatase
VSRAQKTLLDALRAAGKIIKDGFGKKKIVSYKSPVSLLTQIDQQAEARIVKMIRRQFPNHSILTEESRPYMKASEYTWIIDPLDGTTNYAHALPYAACSIALRRQDQMILGGVFDPFRDELFLAERGKGTRLNGKPIRVSRTRKLKEAVLLTGFPYDRRKKASLYMKPWLAFMMRAQALRWEGAAALDMCWVACGRADGFWEWNLQPWDGAAGSLIVEEAGGKMSDFSGKSYSPFGLQTLATNDRVHCQMLSVFRTTQTHHR